MMMMRNTETRHRCKCELKRCCVPWKKPPFSALSVWSKGRVVSSGMTSAARGPALSRRSTASPLRMTTIGIQS